MTAAEEHRINAMATARAIKATRIYVDIALMIGHPPTVADIESMNEVGRDAAVRSAGVKVASEGTWRVVKAIATAFAGAGARRTSEALPVASGPPGRVVLPDGCVDGHSPDRFDCELGSDWG